jgi:hypothetical protein
MGISAALVKENIGPLRTLNCGWENVRHPLEA